MKEVVLDASVFLPLLLNLGRRFKELSERLSLHVLDLTVYEVCNGLWKESSKLKRIDARTASELCYYSKEVANRCSEVHPISELDVRKVIEIALESGLTFYDSSYLELAKELGAALATEDRELSRVAPEYGVEVLNLNEILKFV